MRAFFLYCFRDTKHTVRRTSHATNDNDAQQQKRVKTNTYNKNKHQGVSKMMMTDQSSDITCARSENREKDESRSNDETAKF